jgi:hypothetical protein
VVHLKGITFDVQEDKRAATDAFEMAVSSPD